jgi:hypothetical protein
LVIAGRAMPLLRVPPAKISTALREIESIGGIGLYEVEGRPYGYFKAWDRHQVRRARISKHPAPPDPKAPTEHALPLESDIEDLIFEALESGKLQVGSNQSAERQVRQGENYFDIIVRTSNATFIFELKRGRLSNKAIGQLRRYIDAVPDSIGVLVGNGMTADFDLSACRDDIAVVTYDDSLRWSLERSAIGIPSTFVSQFPSVISRENTNHKAVAAPNSDSYSHSDLNSSEGESEGKPDKPPPLTPEDLVEGWNEVCAPAGLPKVEMLSATRRQKALCRLRDHPDDAFWNVAMARVRASPFLTGKNERKWKANFDWLIDNDTNAVKVYEGRYAKEN